MSKCIKKFKLSCLAKKQFQSDRSNQIQIFRTLSNFEHFAENPFQQKNKFQFFFIKIKFKFSSIQSSLNTLRHNVIKLFSP